MDALSDRGLNLQEAAQLSRLSPARLDCSRRAEVLRRHLSVQGSQTRLRVRIKELLGEVTDRRVSAEGVTGVVTKVDEMLEVDPSRARLMFWEEMKRLFYAMKEIEP